MFATQIVRFNCTIDTPPSEHYGLLLNDDRIICLCCGSFIPKDAYEIIERHSNIAQAETALEKYFTQN